MACMSTLSSSPPKTTPSSDPGEYVDDSSAFAGLTLTDHFFKVPLDYADESRGDINLFVRVAMKQGHAESARLPSLLFLQGRSHQHALVAPKIVYAHMATLERKLSAAFSPQG